MTAAGSKLAAIAVVAIAFTHPAEALGQGYEAEVRLDQMQPASAGSPFTRAEGPHEAFDEGIAYAFRLTGDYGYGPLQSTAPGAPGGDEELFLVEHALLVHAGGSISPLYWLNLELGMPFAVFEKGEDDVLRVEQQKKLAGEPGLGDLRFGAHVRAVSTEPFDLSFGARFWAPTGSTPAYMRGNDLDFRVELVPAIAGEVDVLLYGCTFGLAPLFFAGRDGDRLAASCAAQFKLAPMIALGLEPHVAVFAFSPQAPVVKSENTPGLGSADIAVQFEPLASVALRFGEFSISLAGGVGLGGAPGTPIGRGMLTLGYSHRGEFEKPIDDTPPDEDLDGIPDEYDACPNAAGIEERRGCPDERDVDGDGIVKADACPNEPGAKYDDPEANGCPDRDNDHFADPVDPCPTEPGPRTNGCPQYARLKGGDFTIEPPIMFDPREATLSETARAALIEVIHTMRTNPKIEQISVAVSTRDETPEVTDQRAAAILAVFGDQDIDSSRFEVVLDDDLDSGRVTVRVVR